MVNMNNELFEIKKEEDEERYKTNSNSVQREIRTCNLCKKKMLDYIHIP